MVPMDITLNGEARHFDRSLLTIAALLDTEGLSQRRVAPSLRCVRAASSFGAASVDRLLVSRRSVRERGVQRGHNV